MQLVGIALLSCLLVLLAAMTVLPFWSVGYWPVRLCDFFRLQIAALAILVMLGFAIGAWRTRRSYASWGVGMVAALAIAGWQLSHVVKYAPGWPRELADAEQGSSSMLRSTVVNLQVDNSQKEKLFQQLEEVDSDLLLLIEINEDWADVLQPLESRYPYRVGVVRKDGLGIVLWSRLALMESEVRHLVAESRASIFAKVKLDNSQIVNYIGLHPLPPGLQDSDDPGRHDSRIRDAELMLVADIVAENPDQMWVVSGDFNDVAWSHTTRLFQRISGLKDPRVGRGLYNTYHAQYPLLRFPIDQVFLSSDAVIHELGRFHPAGSDHFAITAAVSFSSGGDTDPSANGSDRREAAEMVDEGMDDAAEEQSEPSSAR